MKKREIRVTNGEKREKGCKVEREREEKREGERIIWLAIRKKGGRSVKV